MSRLVAASPLLVVALAGCSPWSPPAGSDPGSDPDGGRSQDGQVIEVDAARDPDAAVDAATIARTWPRTAGELRAALGGRGTWTTAWQLDEASGRAGDDLGADQLVPAGTVAYRQPGAWPDDRAIGFDSADDALVATTAPFELIRTRSVGALFSVRFDGTGAGTTVAARRDPTGGALLLAIDPSTGQLSAELSDGSHAAIAILGVDHRDGRYHDVLVTIDRGAELLRIQSDLGRSSPSSIATVGDVTPAAPFAIGASRGGSAAAASLSFAAIATGDVAALATGADDALRALRAATERPAPIVRPPAGLPWSPPWPIRRDLRGRYTIDVDPHALPLVTEADLWISPAGDDAQPGTAGQPKRSLHAALAAMTTSTTIHLAAGTYDASAGWWGVSPAHDVNLIAEGGRARITTADLSLAWHDDGGGVFRTLAPAAPYAVVDTATAGVDPWLTARASVAEVAAEPGTWFASGSTVVVHTRDDQPPGARISVLPAATLNGFVDDPDRSLYLQGLDLEGGYKALHLEHAHRLIVVDTSFRYGAGEGLSVLATDEVLAFGAVAEANAWDGLAYSTTPHILEVDCAGRDNGRGGSNHDNGSTVHSGGTVIRIGGDYRANGGPNVADVQGARSWDLGSVAAGTHATSSSQRVNFYIDGEMWLREASARDLAADDTVDLVVAPGARLHAFDSDHASAGGTGAIDENAD